MSTEAFNTMRKNLVESVTGSALDWLAYMGTDAALAAIPDTNPPRYVVAGTLADIVKLLPATEAFTVPPLTAPAPLTDEWPTAADIFADNLDNIAEQWAGCIYQAPADDIDIGESLRREFAKLDRSATKAAPAAPVQTAQPQPSFFVIVGKDGIAEFVTTQRQAAQEHINDACADGVEGAGEWEAVPVYMAAPVQAEQAQAEPVSLRDALQSMEMALIGYTHQNDVTKAALAKCRAALAAPAASHQTEPVVFDDFPEFNAQAMGCGLEDRGITDRYDAMRYGFEEALDLVDERIKNFLADIALPAQAEQAAAVRAAALQEGLEMAARHLDKQRLAVDQDHAYQEPDTGAWVFDRPETEEYSNTLAELAEEIRALIPPSTATSNDTGALGDTGGAK